MFTSSQLFDEAVDVLGVVEKAIVGLRSGLSDMPMPMRSGAMARPKEVTCGMMLRHRYDDVGLP